jgi:O-methyltransferase
VEEDVEYEVAVRGKVKSDVTKEFFSNSKYFFDKNMVLNSIRRVKSIRADVCAFDFAVIGKVSLALVDVDLYRPVKKAVRHLYEQLEVGGMIIVDDCKANNRFDGALQAYTEFVKEYGLLKRIEHQKLGVITKTE